MLICSTIKTLMCNGIYIMLCIADNLQCRQPHLNLPHKATQETDYFVSQHNNNLSYCSLIITSRNVAMLYFGLNAYMSIALHAPSVCAYHAVHSVWGFSRRVCWECYLPVPIDTLYGKNVGTRHNVRNMALGKFVFCLPSVRRNGVLFDENIS